MRTPEQILSEIQEINSIIADTKNLIFEFSDDNFLKITLTQAEERKTILNADLLKSVSENERHSICFVIEEHIDGILLETFTNGLNFLKSILDKSYEMAINIKQAKLPILFNTTYNGSFGILLTTPFEYKLLDKNYNKGISFAFETFQSLVNSNESNLSEIIKDKFKSDLKFVNRYSIFLKYLADTEKDFRLEWHPPNSNKIEVKLPKEITKSIYQNLKQQIKPEITEIEIYGIIKGISLISFKIEFKKDITSEDIIKAKFDSNLTEIVKEYIDRFSICKFKVVTEMNEITEEQKNSYELINISPAP